MGWTRGALSLVGALLFAGGCAHDFVDRVDLRMVRAIDTTATMRIDVTVYAVRDYPDCTIFSPAARGTIDGLPLELKSHGAAASGMVFSGIELPPPKKCAGGSQRHEIKRHRHSQLRRYPLGNHERAGRWVVDSAGGRRRRRHHCRRGQPSEGDLQRKGLLGLLLEVVVGAHRIRQR